MPIALVRGGTHRSHFPLRAGTFSCLNLCKSCVCCHSPMCLEYPVFSVSSVTSGSHNLPASSSAQSPEPWGKGFDILWRTDSSKVSQSQHIVQLEISVLSPVYSRKRLLRCKARIPGYSSMPVGGIILLSSFSGTVVVSSLRGP